MRTTARAERSTAIRSTPASVSFCTTHSGRSPFTGTNPTVTGGVKRGTTVTGPSASSTSISGASGPAPPDPGPAGAR